MKPNLVIVIFVSLVTAASLAAGCSQTGPSTSAINNTPKPIEATNVAGWQADWAKTLEQAKKEGSLVIFSTWPSEVRSAMTDYFKQKYGVGLEWVTGSGGELEQKIYAQRRAGLYQADMWLGGVGTPVNSFQPNGVLDSLDDLLVLPDVTSPEAWPQNVSPYIDPKHQIYSLALSVKIPVEVNTDMVKAGEIKSYRDLLNPKWKNKIVSFDPTIAGTANSWVTTVAISIMNLDYIKELAKQELVIVRDERQAAEWVARGKYPMFIGVRPDVVTVLRSEGAPLAGVIPAEGAWVQSGPAGMVMYNRPADPAAAKVFVNWILSKDGQTLYSKLSGLQAARNDIPTDHLYKLEVRDPNVKYPNADDLENNLLRPKYREIAKEIFGPYMK